MKFKEWDRVVIGEVPPWLKGKKATVITPDDELCGGSLFYALRLDEEYKNGHSCRELCEIGYGYWVMEEYLTLITNKEA